MISNHGRVYSLITNKVLKQHLTTHGYCHVNLHKNKRQVKYKVHRLVAECFIDNKQSKPCVNHIDMDRTNNIVCNLEWVTPLENNIHRLAME